MRNKEEFELYRKEAENTVRKRQTILVKSENSFLNESSFDKQELEKHLQDDFLAENTSMKMKLGIFEKDFFEKDAKIKDLEEKLKDLQRKYSEKQEDQDILASHSGWQPGWYQAVN